MLNIAVLVSGGGTNLQAVIDAVGAGEINGRITAVISSRPGAYALERAKKNGIPGVVIDRKSFGAACDFDRALLDALHTAGAELIVLAGFLSILGQPVTDEYSNRIINVHPSLIPAFCGGGFYGLRVHEAALRYGVKVTGATVHFVNNVVDGGAVILQKAVEVKQDDTPETLQQRVMKEAEWVILPRAVALFCDGKISIEQGRALIRE
jgi:phosphoribosylglycinamide formyltransferase-1